MNIHLALLFSAVSCAFLRKEALQIDPDFQMFYEQEKEEAEWKAHRNDYVN